MKKTPSVFLRNPENMRQLTHEVNPSAQWVLNGEGVATRKYDGTCVMFDGESWWARREVKKDKVAPPNWVELDADPETGKRMGWEPMEQSGFNKALVEAVTFYNENLAPVRGELLPGTYELMGPKIGGNPEDYPVHVLARHEDAERFPFIIDPSMITDPFEFLKDFLVNVIGEFYGWEGIVWHHPDGRMAKLKVRDFKEEK